MLGFGSAARRSEVKLRPALASKLRRVRDEAFGTLSFYGKSEAPQLAERVFKQKLDRFHLRSTGKQYENGTGGPNP